MIRVIILLVFLFLAWVLYASGFEKARKTRISLIALVLCALAFWFDGYDKREIRNLVKLSDVMSCGLSAKHSYRTNFDITICVENNAEKGTISRLDFAVIASDCEGQVCTELQRAKRSLLVNIPPSSTTTLEQNLSFGDVKPLTNDVQWTIEFTETKALR